MPQPQDVNLHVFFEQSSKLDDVKELLLSLIKKVDTSMAQIDDDLAQIQGDMTALTAAVTATTGELSNLQTELAAAIAAGQASGVSADTLAGFEAVHTGLVALTSTLTAAVPAPAPAP